MPIYEYDCPRCQHMFETLVLNRSAAVCCPQCGSEEVEQRFSVFGFQSKGSGGESHFVSSSGSGCGNCHASSCHGCGHH